MGREEDFKASSLLASDMSRWVTGQNIVVDGAGQFVNINFIIELLFFFSYESAQVVFQLLEYVYVRE